MPAAPPITGAFARDLYQQLRLMVPDDEAHGWPYAHYLAALCSPAELVESWVRDEDDAPGWSILLDLDRCPEIALPWLAMFRGVQIPKGMASEDWREWIRSAEGLRRGSPAALVKAGQRHLTGDKLVRVLYRQGPTWYDTTVVVRASECPDPAQTLVDLNQAKRIGLRLTLVVSDSPIIDEGTIAADSAAVDFETATLADVT